MNFQINEQYIHAATGGRQHQESEDAVILIHGAGMNRTAWQLQTRNLSYQGFRTYAFDLPGHGRSDGPELKSIPEMADWLKVTLNFLNINQATIIGHSMGALIALEFGSKFYELTKTLVLIGVADSMPVHIDLLTAAEKNPALANKLITLWGISGEAHKGGHIQPGYWLTGANHNLLELSNQGVLFSDLSACNNYTRALEAARNIKVPVKLILGNEDKMTPKEKGIFLSESIGNSSVDIIPVCGHMIMIEKPEEVYKSLKTFLCF